MTFFFLTFKIYLFIFDVDCFKNLYWICYNTASVLCFGFVFFFGCEVDGIPSFPPPALEDEVLTTGLPKKSLANDF